MSPFMAALCWWGSGVIGALWLAYQGFFADDPEGSAAFGVTMATMLVPPAALVLAGCVGLTALGRARREQRQLRDAERKLALAQATRALRAEGLDFPE